MDKKEIEKRIEETERKIAVLTEIFEERLGIEVDFRSEVEKFIDDFVDKANFESR